MSFKSLFISMLTIATVLHSQASSTYMSPPKLHFIYDWRGKSIDVIGYYLLASKFGFQKVTTQDIKNLKKKILIVKAAWQEEAPILFGEVFSYFNRGFLTQSKIVSLFFGATAGYAGNDTLLLGLSFLWDNETWHNSISREEYFRWLLFHELLHTWLDDNLGSDRTELLKKHTNETAEVREHIHLMAIQKMVYLKLNRLDLLEFCDQCYRRNPDGYRRSWEIINDIEGHERVIKDLENHFMQQIEKPLQQQSTWNNVKSCANIIKDMFDKAFW